MSRKVRNMSEYAARMWYFLLITNSCTTLMIIKCTSKGRALFGLGQVTDLRRADLQTLAFCRMLVVTAIDKTHCRSTKIVILWLSNSSGWTFFFFLILIITMFWLIYFPDCTRHLVKVGDWSVCNYVCHFSVYLSSKLVQLYNP